MQNDIVSLFSGCGGLDLGFSKAGFDVVWANEFDKAIWETYEKNHSHKVFDRRSIRDIPSKDIPDCIGIIGGPPCQSWSEAGTQKGLGDERGQLFWEYVRILKDKQPSFFLAENVSGMLHKKHNIALHNITAAFEEAGYVVAYRLLDAKNYNVPQERKRIIFVGFHVRLGKRFHFDAVKLSTDRYILRQAIGDLQGLELSAIGRSKTNGKDCPVPNHEYMQGGFSSIYMSRNRVRSWNEPSFTIQASGRHAPIHPQANRMIHIGKDKWIFDPESHYPYRRLTVRECARIQTFPDDFIFYYQDLSDAYKMIGNAVPVNFAYEIAQSIRHELSKSLPVVTLMREQCDFVG
ncbi:MAG: DNA cytosine methyltransferase [Rhizonema sp. PD38]|nr:DNA cytosine methyltransferase [Rhizonema sp. PD38]